MRDLECFVIFWLFNIHSPINKKEISLPEVKQHIVAISQRPFSQIVTYQKEALDTGYKDWSESQNLATFTSLLTFVTFIVIKTQAIYIYIARNIPQYTSSTRP